METTTTRMTKNSIEEVLFSQKLDDNYFIASPEMIQNAEAISDWRQQDDNHIFAVVDGACSGNGKETSKGGWGIILMAHSNGRYICRVKSGSIPGATNNQAELIAIAEAAKALTSKVNKLTIISDSSYAIGALNGTNKVKANVELIRELQPIVNNAAIEVDLIHTAGHNGYLPNEYVNILAQDEAGSLLRR